MALARCKKCGRVGELMHQLYDNGYNGLCPECVKAKKISNRKEFERMCAEEARQEEIMNSYRDW